MMDDGCTDSDTIWVARQVVRQHTEPPSPDRATGSCPQCTEDGCRMLVWATAELAEVEV